MKYRVVFRERVGNDRSSGRNPVEFLQNNSFGSVIRSSRFVLRNDPEFKPVSDSPEDNLEFQHLGTEVWEYDVAEGRDQEFKDALLNSGSFVEFAPILQSERDSN
jgi:hypothetical protein